MDYLTELNLVFDFFICIFSGNKKCEKNFDDEESQGSNRSHRFLSEPSLDTESG